MVAGAAYNLGWICKIQSDWHSTAFFMNFIIENGKETKYYPSAQKEIKTLKSSHVERRIPTDAPFKRFRVCTR